MFMHTQSVQDFDHAFLFCHWIAECTIIAKFGEGSVTKKIHVNSLFAQHKKSKLI